MMASDPRRAAPSLLLLFLAWTPAAAAQEQAPPQEPAPAPYPDQLCAAFPTGTPTGLATGLDDLARTLELRTTPEVSRTVRRHSEAVWGRPCGAGNDRDWGDAVLPWRVTLLPVDATAVERTGYPDDRNNGAMWEGRGLSARVRGGARLELPYVTAAVAPELVFAQNGGYQFPRRLQEGFSEFIYSHYAPQIDLPHRPGSGARASAEWGQSYIRVDAYGGTAGISAENVWWGPAVRYPLLMSNTAPGLPHIFFGTSDALDVRIGRLDAEVMWGRSTESDYFDEIPENDRHMVGGISLAFSPRPLPGLWIGLARILHYADDGWGDLGQLVAATGLGGIDAAGNDIASFYARWVFPEAGAEVYGEWAREDRANDVHELIQEPDHSQGYMLGFQKLTDLDDRFGIRVQGEVVALQELPELRLGSRPLPVFYTHSGVPQGHTHRGQLLGAGIGPGGDAQFLAVDALSGEGRAGLYLERVRRADFASDALDLRRHAPYEHDAEITLGVRAAAVRGDLAVSGGLAYSYRYNRDFRDDDVNWTLSLQALWVPDLGWASP